MRKLPILHRGDRVEIIAPASRCSNQHLFTIKELLSSFGLNCVISNQIFGEDLLCANSDIARFILLKNAIANPTTKAIICARGGYGSMRIIPYLQAMSRPWQPKIFLGMSDITALHLFFQQCWGWPTIHGNLNVANAAAPAMAKLRSMLFGETEEFVMHGSPLNAAATNPVTSISSLVGGNLSLIQASIGTSWQVQGVGKIILLEDIGERAYQIDRMLEHLWQAQVFKDAVAILFGDFTHGLEPNGQSLIEPVIKRFAERCDIPVVQINGIGHNIVNFPIPLGTKTIAHFGENIKLIFRN